MPGNPGSAPRWAASGERPKNIRGTLRRLIGYMGDYRREVYAGIAFSVLSTVFSLIGPQYLEAITDEISSAVLGGRDIDTDLIAGTAFFLLAVYALSMLFMTASDYLIPAASEKIANLVRRDLSRKINTVPLNYYDGRTTGDVMSLMTNDADIIGNQSADCITQAVSSVTIAVGAVAMMLYTDWKLAALTALPTAAGLLFMLFIIRHSGKYFSRQSRDLGIINGIVDENYYGHEIVRTYNGEEAAMERFADVDKDLFRSSFLARTMGGTMPAAISFASNISYVAVCVFGSMLIVGGEIGYGVVVAFIVYSGMLSRPMMMLSESLTSMQSVSASADRIFAFLDTPDMPDESSKTARPGKVRGSVEFDGLRFSYVPGREVIRGLNISVSPGEKVAIVGPTGAGKTTLANLMLRFYDADSGDIRIDGVSIYDMKREDVRSLFCMVLQDSWVFDGTIRENVAYGCGGVSDSRLEEILGDVGLGPFLESHAGGLDAKIAASSLSSGQRQQISIARAMAKDAPLLILDEATSSVDTITERRIQDAMDHLMRGRTSFVIAHRLSTIVNSDIILVVRDGSIVEKGSHSELMALNGFYRSLYDSQFEGCD